MFALSFFFNAYNIARNILQMKKILLSIFTFSLASSFSVVSQTSRTVLLEWFTSTGCGPCTWQGPRMDSLHDNNPTSTLITLEYHGNYGNIDPMYFHNTTEPNSRFSFYGFSGYPSGSLDGNFYSGHPSNINQSKVNTRSAVTSPFTIELSHKINNNGTLDVTAKAKAVQAVSGNLKLHIVVVEKHIITRKVERNGETHWTNVMKKMLPNQNGTALATSWAIGDSTTVNQSWTIQNVYNVDELAVIAFIQNTTTKEILQAKFDDSSLKYTMEYNLADNVYTKFIGKGATANYNADIVVNSDTGDTYEVSLANTLPPGWSASFTIDGNTYTNPANIHFNAVETKSITVSVTASSAGDERGTVTLQMKSATRIGAYKKQLPTYTFCSVTNLVDDKYTTCDTSIVNALQAKGLPAVKITDYEIDGLDSNGMDKANLAHFLYSVSGRNIFHGITDNKLKIFKNYLTSHGNILFISETMGQEVNNVPGYYIISNEYSDFYANYIGANYVSSTFISSSSTAPLNYTTGDSMYKYAGSTLLGGSFSYIEWFTPTQGAKSTLRYSNDAAKIGGSIQHNTVDNWKIAYWGFNFASLSTTDGYRNNILKTTIDWFDGVALDVAEQQNEKIYFSAYPNPAKGVVNISAFDLENKSNQVNIVDAMGRTIKSTTINGNIVSESVDVSELSSGIYFVQLISDAEIVGAQRLIIVE